MPDSEPTRSSVEAGNTSLAEEVSEISKDLAVPEELPIAPVPIPWWIALLHGWQQRGMVLLICLSGLTPVAVQFLPHTASSPRSPEQQVISRADYERLELGMTLTDAQATIGRAIEISRDEASATYKWVNGDGSEITATFERNRLVKKEQLGLK